MITMVVRVAVAVAVAACTLSCLAASAGEGVIRIGVLTDLTGPASDIGKGSVAAAQIAVEEFGGKVLGRPIEVLSADTGNKADIASAVARRWLDVEKVDALVDLGLTNTALAVLPIAAEKNKVAIAVSAAGAAITNEACTSTSFHWMYDTNALAAGVTKALIDKGLKTWFFVTTDYSFGQSLERDASTFIETHGGKVVGSIRHPFNVADVSSFMLTAQQSGAQVIGLANSNNDTVNAIKASRDYGITPKQYIAPLVVYLSTVHGMGLDLAQGIYLTEGWYWNDDERARKFGAAFEKKTGTKPGSLPAGTYSAVLSYLKAVQAVGSDDTARVVKFLKSEKIDDAVIRNGRVRDDGRLVHDMNVYQVKKPGESKGPFDYYNFVGSVPGDEAFQSLSTSRCPLVKK